MRIALVGALATGLVLPMLSGQAQAAPAPAPQDQRASEEGAATEALEEAARTGRRAEVTAQRTQFSTVFANPDGTFTQETAAVPLRVRQAGKLVDVDTDLERAGAVVRPKAVDVGLEFSGGGDTPLVTIVRDGRSLTVDWPEALPKPRLEGDTATYEEVEPGIDLRMKAAVDGYQQLLVVKTPEAAKNPLLKKVRYDLASDGVKARTDEAGNLRAVDPAGKEVFTAPAPEMWDSTGVPDTQLAKASSTTEVSGLLARRSGRPAGPDEDVFEPRYGANTASMPVEVGSGQLTLTPDQKVLSDPDTVFPVYIDPTVSSARLGWTSVAAKYPTTSYWNHSSKVARVGYESDTGGTWRSFVQFDPRSLHGRQIVKSTLRIKNTHSWSCTKKPVEAWLTGEITSATTWAKQPTWGTKYDTVTDAKGWAGSCPAGNLEFNVKTATERAAAGKWTKLAIGLRASESDVFAWKKFDATTAVLSTDYNSVPDQPTALDTAPSTRINNTCGDQGTYVTVGNTDVTLTARVSDPDGGSVKAHFELWPTGKPSGTPGKFVDREVSVTSGTVARTTVAKSLLAQHVGASNGSFSWRVRTKDAHTVSEWNPVAGAPGCRFAFDPVRPSNPPGVSSTQFPDGHDGWPANTSPVRTEGSFVLSAGGVGDVVKYEYWSDTDQTRRTVDAASAGGTATVKFTPTRVGANQLYVRSLDRAGNSSDTYAYLYYAKGLPVPDKPGDLNGDGHADLWAVDADATLQRYFGSGDGKVAKASSAASTPGSYGNRKITHRGDWTDDGFEDLVVLEADKALNRDRLWVHPNDGFGYACVECAAGNQDDRRELAVYDEENEHWQGADQVLAIGDVDGPLVLDGRTERPGYPDLLVKKGDQLWLYFGSPSGYLDEYLEQPPVLLGDSGWSGLDLVAPGDENGDGHLDLITRDRATGLLHLYTGTGPEGQGLGDHGSRQQVGTGYTTTNRPLITSAPDATGAGKSTLWTTGPSGELFFYPDIRGRGTAVGTGFTGYRSLG